MIVRGWKLLEIGKLGEIAAAVVISLIFMVSGGNFDDWECVITLSGPFFPCVERASPFAAPLASCYEFGGGGRCRDLSDRGGYAPYSFMG